MMALSIVLGVVVSIVIFIVGLSMRESPKSRAYQRGVKIELHPAPCSQELVPLELKAAVQAIEIEAFSKAEEVRKIVEHETGLLYHHDEVVNADPLNETAFFRAISNKVEKVKRLSVRG